MANFPLIWTESGADTQNNNWGQVIKDWATTEHSTTGTHGAVTSTSLSVSGAAGIGGIAVPASGLAVLGTSAGIVGQINITSGGIAVNGINASTSSAAVVGQSTGYYGGHFYNITDLGSDLANASAIGIVGHSV